jgi:branched-chain amino acid aminotransferase
MKAKSFYIFLDGQYLNADPKVIEALTPGRFKAQGVFETIRVADGKAEFLNEHLNRLMRGLKALKIKHSYLTTQLKRITSKIVKGNKGTAHFLRLRIMVWKDKSQIHCAVMALPYHAPTLVQYKQGLKVCFIKTKRKASARTSEIKSLDYQMFADAFLKAKTQGFDDALLINSKGHVFESTRANLFISYQGQWMTPHLSSGCLNGIVRQEVFKMAAKLKIPILEKSLTPQMVKGADSAFLTNSLVGLIPIF